MKGFGEGLWCWDDSIGHHRSEGTKDHPTEHENWVVIENILFEIQSTKEGLIGITTFHPLDDKTQRNNGGDNRHQTSHFLRRSGFVVKIRRSIATHLGYVFFSQKEKMSKSQTINLVHHTEQKEMNL
jgi:hypothetical protein